MTEAHPTVKQYHAVHRMLNGFTSYMKMKMHENMHKGTWEECTYEYLRNRITEELKEFDLAIAEGRYDDARLEAADVGNFFGMISDNIAYGRFKNYNCASHSSAKSDAVLKKALRVIEELIECDCVPNDMLHPDETGCLCPPERDCHLCKMNVLKELRTKER